MKTKLYFLFALLSLTAVFASPALAAPPVPNITNLNDGDVVNAGVSIWIETDAPADTVQVFGLDGVPLDDAEPVADSNHMIWTAYADLSGEADSLSYPLTVTATTGAESSSDSVTVQLDKVPSPAAPNWLSLIDGMEFSGSIDLRTSTVSGLDYVEYLVDGFVAGQGVDTSPGGSSTWDYSLNLELYSLGQHSLTAVAHVGDEFSAASETTITVVDGTMPVIGEILPADETVVSGTVQLSASITDNRGVTSAEYSIDDQETWLPLVRNVGDERLWQASIDTTELPNGQRSISVRAHDNNVNGLTGDAFVSLVVQNDVAPVLNMDDVTFFGNLIADGFGIYAEGATATGFPEPELIYSWFVCDAGFHCINHPGQSYTPTAAEIGHTVRFVVRATSWNGPNGSVEANIFVGTVEAAPVFVDSPADPPVVTQDPPVVVTSPVKSPEVVKAEEKVVEAAKSVEAAKAEVTEQMKDVVVAQAVVKKAKKKAAAAKANVKEANAEVKDEAKDVAVAKTLVKKAKKAKKNAAKKALAEQAKELAASQKEALAAAKAEEAARQKLAAALKTIEAEQNEIKAAQKKLEASQTELSNSQKQLNTVK